MKKNIVLVFILVFFSVIQSINAQEFASEKAFEKTQPIREVKRNVIAANFGWKSLTGVGFTYHNYVHKQMAVDMGIGVALTGVKLGARYRYLFSPKNFSPYVSAGFNYGLGSGGVEIVSLDQGNFYKYTVGPSSFFQLAAGIEYLANKGFLFQFDVGYAFLLSGGDYEITEGTPNEQNRWALDAQTGSGIVFEFTLGYAFGGGK